MVRRPLPWWAAARRGLHAEVSLDGRWLRGRLAGVGCARRCFRRGNAVVRAPLATVGQPWAEQLRLVVGVGRGQGRLEVVRRKARVGGLEGGECGSQREGGSVGRQQDNPDMSRREEW
jgi:hypothetical protein